MLAGHINGTATASLFLHDVEFVFKIEQHTCHTATENGGVTCRRLVGEMAIRSEYEKISKRILRDFFIF
jgi:hypothetical protein